MTIEKSPDDKFLISLSDVLALLRKAKGKILFSTFLMGSLGLLWGLNKPLKYTAEGTFREKSNKSGYISGGLTQALLGDSFGSTSENEALSLIKSRKLMQDVIDKLNLQGHISLSCNREGFFTRVKNNLKLEWALWRKSPYSLFPDLHCPLIFEKIHYPGEVPVFLKAYANQEGHYDLYDTDKGMIGQLQLGQPFNYANYSFIIKTKKDPSDTDGTELPFYFQITLSPLSTLSTVLTKELKVDNVKTDKGVLKIEYQDRDRYLASQFVNTIMAVYQDHMKAQQGLQSSVQMDYLYKKQEESSANLKKLMEEYADYLSSDASKTGFIDSKNEIDFLVKSQHELKEKLLANELEMKRLKNLESNQYAHYDQYAVKEGNTAVINVILTDIRSLRQERDALELALKKQNYTNKNELEKSFNQQVKELKYLQQQKIDLQQIMHAHQTGQPIDVNFALLNDPQFLIKEWVNKISGDKTDKETQASKEHFSTYLENLYRLFNVHEKILQERLTHQQNVSDDYQGINLKTATELYLEYSRKLNEEEALIRRTSFFLNRMEQDAEFEITSLSAVLMDPVSMGMINRASDLVLRLKDEGNQSVKEQNHLKMDLKLQRMFLASHLGQMVQLMELNKKLISEKIYALQNVSLELIHQQISLLEKNLIEYVQSRLANLEQERSIVEQHLKEIQQELSELPKKWVAEQLINQQVETNQSLLKEIAKIVESKNISNNLEIIQSAPIDLAIPSLNPKSPGLALYTILGVILGGLFGSFFALGKALNRGIQVSAENLRIIGHSVSGSFSVSYDPTSKIPMADEDLNTLRRVHSYFEGMNRSNQPFAHALLLIEGQGPDYSTDLAHLFAKTGEKVLVVDLDFNRMPNSSSEGLLQYLSQHLKGEKSPLSIKKATYGDYIPAGGFNRFAVELVNSRSFKELIEDLSTKYDWIIAVSHAIPKSADAESLAKLFSNVVITVKNESVEDLGFYSDLKKNSNKVLTFVF